MPLEARVAARVADVIIDSLAFHAADRPTPTEVSARLEPRTRRSAEAADRPPEAAVSRSRP